MEESSDSAFGGFADEKAKSAFTLRASITLGVMALLQFVLPLVAIIPIWLNMFRSDLIRIYEPSSTVRLENDYWFATPANLFQIPDNRSGNFRYEVFKKSANNSASDAITAKSIIVQSQPILTVVGKKIWVIDKNGATDLDTGKKTEKKLKRPQQALEYNNELWVVDKKKKFEFDVHSFRTGKVEKIASIQLKDLGKHRSTGKFKVIKHRGKTHCFFEVENVVYHHVGFPPKGSNPEKWKSAAIETNSWDPFVDQGTLHMAARYYEEHKGILVLFHYKNGQWHPGRETPLQGYLIRALTGGEKTVLITGPQPLEATSIQGGEFGDTQLIAGFGEENFKDFFGSIFFPLLWIYPLLFVAPLPAGWLLDRWIPKYREVGVVLLGTHWKLASIMRRAMAKILDTVITTIPLLVIAIGTWYAMDPGEKTEDQLIAGLAAIGVYVGLSPIISLILVFMEGRWGYTPGKWLLGLKVLADDGRPCGFWKDLGRSLLIIADSFFQFGVGLGFIAFTRRSQRVGDLAMKTYVVHGQVKPPQFKP